MVEGDLTNLLRRLDLVLSELADIRRELAPHLTPAQAAEGNGLDAGSDFAEHNLASVQAASERWKYMRCSSASSLMRTRRTVVYLRAAKRA